MTVPITVSTSRGFCMKCSEWEQAGCSFISINNTLRGNEPLIKMDMVYQRTDSGPAGRKSRAELFYSPELISVTGTYK